MLASAIVVASLGLCAAPLKALHPSEATKRLLEWERIENNVATHADTDLAPTLVVPTTRRESQILLDETKEAVLLARQQSLRIARFADLEPTLSYARKGGVLDGAQLAELAASLASANALVRALRDARDVASTAAANAADTTTTDATASQLVLLPSLFDNVPVQAETRRLIDECIDDSGEVRDSAAPQLGELRGATRTLAAKARSLLVAYAQRKADCLTSRTTTVRDERYVLQVAAKQRHRVPGITRDVSSSGATLFIEPKEVEPANTKLRQLAKREASLCRAVCERLSRAVGDPRMSDELLELQRAVRRVDGALARARYSLRLGGTLPRFTSARDAGLRLHALRHPLLAWPSAASEPAPGGVVPQSYHVSPATRAIVVTGPNTGGKTVALKNLALAALMAKAGLYILAEPDDDAAAVDSAEPVASIPWFDEVMADIGDEQSLQQSLSTFSAHVARVGAILDASTPDSLVLLDEVGAGTDPTEGVAIGTAVLQELASSVALAMCTTHHGSLKSLKYSDERFENACVEFDDESMAPTYRLLWGIPGRSNALAIARRLGMRADILGCAESLLGEGQMEVAEVLKRLEEDQEVQRALREELRSLRDEAAAEREALQAQLRESAAREARQAEEQRAALAAALDEAKADMARLVKESGGDASGAGHRLAQIGRRAAESESDQGRAPPATGASPSTATRAPEVGDSVLVGRLGEAPVRVEEVRGKQLMVAFGGLTMKVKLSEVESVVPAPAAPSGGGGGGGGRRKSSGASVAKKGTAVRMSSNTLDLRGQRVGSMGNELGLAIDRALGMGTLYVIHGHGTGSMRKYVREALAEEPMVVRFEDAPEKEGGRGCTIAYLRV